MTDHYREAERLTTPIAPPGISSAGPPNLGAPIRSWLEDPVTAQVHATLAVAGQLARIASMLEALVEGQGSNGSQ
jgi:hypothetical protein